MHGEHDYTDDNEDDAWDKAEAAFDKFDFDAATTYVSAIIEQMGLGGDK